MKLKDYTSKSLYKFKPLIETINLIRLAQFRNLKMLLPYSIFNVISQDMAHYIRRRELYVVSKIKEIKIVLLEPLNLYASIEKREEGASKIAAWSENKKVKIHSRLLEKTGMNRRSGKRGVKVAGK